MPARISSAACYRMWTDEFNCVFALFDWPNSGVTSSFTSLLPIADAVRKF
jgi:hypothetical protein